MTVYYLKIGLYWVWCKFLRLYNLLTYRHFIKENVYGLIFESARVNLPWLVDKVFFPSKSAANYSFLYIYLRALLIASPKRILELGLGQSTILSASYAKENPDVSLEVLEDDELWIRGFNSGFKVSDNVDILHRPLIETTIDMATLNSQLKTNWYDFRGEKKYDLLVIDAPCGTSKYSRVGVMRIIPNCLADDFIIIIDDYNIFPTRQTGVLIQHTLQKKNINFESFIVEGVKQQLCIVSDKYKFMASI